MQLMVGQMSLIAFCIFIFVSIIVSYGCVYMSSTHEIVPNQDRHVGINFFSGFQTESEPQTRGACT